MRTRVLSIICLLFSTSIIAVASNYLEQAKNAFDKGDYALCIELFEQGGMKEIKEQEQNDLPVSESDLLCLAESYIALGNFDKALHALTDNHRVLNRKTWINGRWWILTADDLKNWPMEKKPILDRFFEEYFAYFYEDDIDGFRRSPLINNIVSLNRTGYSLNELISWAADVYYRTAIEIQHGYYYEHALPHYCSAADFGKIEAQKELGRRYLKGEDVSRDTTKALHYLEMAAQQGDIEAGNFVANCYMNGNGVMKDYDKAFSVFSTNAQKNDKTAKYGLGLCYYYGYGTTPNKGKSLEYLKDVSDWFVEVPYIIGVIYYERMSPMAISYFEMALSRKGLDKNMKGDILRKLSACNRFGYCGVSVNLDKAEELLDKSAQYGEERAIDVLERFNVINQAYSK